MNIRSIRRGASILAATALLGLALAGPGLVGAATPSTETSIAAAPATVLTGARGAFVATLKNTDSSTISQLYLAGTLTGTGTGTVVTFVAAYPSQGTCSVTVVSCSFGQVKPGAANAVSVTIVYQTTASTTSVTGDFIFSTVGLGSGSGDQSHGDSWPLPSTTVTASSDPNFGGRYIDDANLVVQNNQSVNDTTNPHATKVIAPKSLIGVTVKDGSDVTQVCLPEPAGCAAMVGETSEVNVGGGAGFTQGFRIILTFDKSELAGATANTLKIWHSWSGGSELISSKCTFSGGSTTPSNMPCLIVKKLPGGDLQVTIWTTHNGVLRGYK